MCVIEVRDLRKTYGTGEVCVHVRRGVDLRIGKGGVVAIMGPSGSGKSTLLHTIVIVTHDLQVAAQAERVIRLCDGVVEAEVPPACQNGDGSCQAAGDCSI